MSQYHLIWSFCILAQHQPNLAKHLLTVLFIGSVALIVGGEGTFDVELYSPEGGCQHLLAPVPGRMTEFLRPVLAYLGGKIMACHGSENNVYCWAYEISNNTWSILTHSTVYKNHFPGKSLFFPQSVSYISNRLLIKK